MNVSFNKKGNKVVFSMGKNRIAILASKLFYVGLPTSVFAIEIDGCKLFRDKLKIVYIEKGDIVFTMKDIQYSRLLYRLEKYAKSRFSNEKPQKGILTYQEFIGGYFNRSYTKILLFENGKIAYDIPENAKYKKNKHVTVDINSLQIKDELTKEQLKTISEVRMRLSC